MKLYHLEEALVMHSELHYVASETLPNRTQCQKGLIR
jgi:hypothetical protein